MAQVSLTSHSAAETQGIARRLGALLVEGDVVALDGDLGAGKTCFVQGLAEGLGIAGPVTSPTFILMREHPGSPPLCHADAYRLGSALELEDLGLQDVLARCVLAIEWAQGVEDALPQERVSVLLRRTGEDCRQIDIAATAPRLAEALQEAFS